jgi:hypothetical protein
MHKIFEFIVEAIGWLWIVASPFLISMGIGAAIYYTNPNTVRLIIAVSAMALGLLIGIVWANKAWRTTGTMHMLSKVMATPELDEKPKEPEKPDGHK